MTLGSLALTGNRENRSGAGTMLGGVSRLPYDGYLGHNTDTTELLDKMLTDNSSGLDKPAAIVVETIQCEGGLNTASPEWLHSLADVARRHDVLLIVDDIQAGCGRTGTFFSFEPSGITPDLICLSKSISGYGLPLALVMLRPHLDVLEPGEHNGTFRGNNLAFVTGKAALELWQGSAFTIHLNDVIEMMEGRLQQIIARNAAGQPQLCGRGAVRGITWSDPAAAGKVSRAAFEHGLIAETCGADDRVLKFMPPLTIEQTDLGEGLERVEAAIRMVFA